MMSWLWMTSKGKRERLKRELAEDLSATEDASAGDMVRIHNPDSVVYWQKEQLARAKARLHVGVEVLPGATWCGIPAEAFSREELLLMLRHALKSVARERRAHDATMGVCRGMGKAKREVEA